MKKGGAAGTRDLKNRMKSFDEGSWTFLISKCKATASNVPRASAQIDEDMELEAKLQNAKTLVKKGELSHAARIIRSNEVAPGNTSTFQQLRDPNLRPRRRRAPIDERILSYVPPSAVEIDAKRFTTNLYATRRSLSAGLGETRNEHLKICLEDEACLNHLISIATFVCPCGHPSLYY